MHRLITVMVSGGIYLASPLAVASAQDVSPIDSRVDRGPIDTRVFNNLPDPPDLRVCNRRPDEGVCELPDERTPGTFYPGYWRTFAYFPHRYSGFHTRFFHSPHARFHR
jgi:hypothetical protein